MEAYDFCKTSSPTKAGKKALSDIQEASLPFSGVEQVLAACWLANFASTCPTGCPDEDLFENPEQAVPPTEEISEEGAHESRPRVFERYSSVKEKIPRKPPPPSLDVSAVSFCGSSRCTMSSEEQVPFPPSPRHPKSVEKLEAQPTQPK